MSKPPKVLYHFTVKPKDSTKQEGKMGDYTELVKALRYCVTSPNGFTDCNGCPKQGHGVDCEDELHTDAAAAIEELEAEVKDLNEALKSESEARQNAEAKRYCCNCAHMDASMYDEAWYGICKLNGFEVGAIHGWGCTDWAKMEVQE